MIVKPTRREIVTQRFFNVVFGFISIVEGIVMILTLGGVTPPWSYNFTAWRIKREAKRRIEESSNGREVA